MKSHENHSTCTENMGQFILKHFLGNLTDNEKSGSNFPSKSKNRNKRSDRDFLGDSKKKIILNYIT